MTVAWATAIAIALWGGGSAPPCGSATVRWGDLPYAGIANTTQCRITLDRALWRLLSPGMRCSLVVHEFGHLYGREHTARGVMAGGDDWFVPPVCVRAVQTFRRSCATAAVLARHSVARLPVALAVWALRPKNARLLRYRR